MFNNDQVLFFIWPRFQAKSITWIPRLTEVIFNIKIRNSVISIKFEILSYKFRNWWIW